MKDYDDILIALRRITRAIDLQSKKLQQRTGLTAPQMLILQAVGKAGHLSPSAIAQEVVLSQATVTNILDRLEKAGLLTRERSTSDKRVVLVHLTDAGEKRLEAAPELLQAGFLREYRKLKDWQQTQIVSSLQHIAAMMQAEEIDASPILEVGEIEQKDRKKI